ncbi:MAG TPA: hypothetical protein VFU53_12685 [Burkholderiales bacterium]|nr:hypothetical protein [Burkholderiales bacterium]
MMEPHHEKLSGSVEYEAALDRLLARPQRRLCLFDRQLGKGFNSAARYDLLRGFLLRDRANRIQVVLHDVSGMARDCPRMMGLLRRFPHALAIHETQPHAKAVYDPFALADERDHLHRFHYDDARALLVLDDPQATLVFVERFAELWAASEPAVFATTLGL